MRTGHDVNYSSNVFKRLLDDSTPVRVFPILAITSANSTTVPVIFLKTEVTFLNDSSDKSSRTFSAICSVHVVIAGFTRLKN
nr:hypothetical protein Iba_chr05cCG12420 [Ipomoea batatas]